MFRGKRIYLFGPWSLTRALNCVIEAWSKYEGGLRGFLLHPLRDPPLAEDLLLDTFLKALSEGSRFCQPASSP